MLSVFSVLMCTIAFSVDFLFILRWNSPAYGRTANIEIIGWQINRVAQAQKRRRFWVHYPSGFWGVFRDSLLPAAFSKPIDLDIRFRRKERRRNSKLGNGKQGNPRVQTREEI